MVHRFGDDPASAGLRQLGFALVDVVTWLIELGVGLGCIAGGVAAVRTGRLRVVGILLLVAGTAASVHAVVALLS